MIQNQKKKKVDITETSMTELMQETYNEIVDERNKAIIAYKKFSKDINENVDIAMVGKITNDLIKIIDGAIEKKLRLIKIQSDIIYKNGKSSSESSNDIRITEEDKKWAAEFMKPKNQGANEKEYE